jgi:hypothetical protein
MLDLIIDGKEISIPTRWEDLTWGKAKGMPREAGPMHAEWVKYFTGIDDVLNKLSIGSYTTIAEAVGAFANEPDTSIENWSRVFEYDGKEYTLTDDVNNMKAGPYLDLVETVKKYAGDSEKLYEGTENIAKLLVEYTIFETDYDYSRATKRDIDSMSFGDVSRIVAFFLKGLTSLKNGTESNSPKAPIRKGKFWQVIRRFQKSSASS